MKQHYGIVTSAKILNVISAALMFVAGLLLLVIPNLGTTTAQRILLCVLFGLTGAAKIFGYFSNDLYRLAFQFDFAIGVYCELLTLLIALLPERVFDVLPLLISIYVVLDALLKLQMSFDAKRFGMKSWVALFVTALPAEAMRFSGKGTLQVGADADINIFRFEDLHERATYASPCQESDGMDTVLVAGKPAILHGAFTGNHNGSVL